MGMHLEGCSRLAGWGTCDCGGGQPQPSEAPSETVRASQTLAQDGGGTPTRPRTREPLSGFVWPCEKRTAHGSHGDCPGVEAHPLTMIGGGYEVETEADSDGD